MRDTIDKYHGDRGRYPDSLDTLVEARYLRAGRYLAGRRPAGRRRERSLRYPQQRPWQGPRRHGLCRRVNPASRDLPTCSS